MNEQMKTNNRYLTIILGCLLLTGSLFAQPAQDKNGPPGLPDSKQIVKMVDELAVTLSLSEEQKTDVLYLHNTHFDYAKELMEEHSSDREVHRKEMETMRQKFEKQVKDLLTVEQSKEFEKFVKSHQGQHGENRPGQQ